MNCDLYLIILFNNTQNIFPYEKTRLLTEKSHLTFYFSFILIMKIILAVAIFNAIHFHVLPNYIIDK